MIDRSAQFFIVVLISLCLFLSANALSDSVKKPTAPRLESVKIEVDIKIKLLDKGVDVSSHSGAVDWNKLVTGGQKFAFTKATEGIDLKDPAFDKNWQAMKQSGIVRGAYHFYVTEDDPQQQAEFFIHNVILESGDLAPVVDVELIGHGTKARLPGRVKIWLKLIEMHYGVKPIIYTSPEFWNKHMNDQFSEYPLWIAEYGVDKTTRPVGWQDWHIWHWDGTADVPGVELGADLSWMNQSGLDLSVLFIP